MTDKERRFQAIDRGRKDWHQGIDILSNPFDNGSIEEYGWWQLGWLKAYYFAAEQARKEAGE